MEGTPGLLEGRLAGGGSAIPIDLGLLAPGELDALEEILGSSERPLLCCHRSPDGDAVGSMAGLADYISRRYRKYVTMVVPDAYPDFLQWVPAGPVLNHARQRAVAREGIASADLAICLDFNSYSRLGEMAADLEASRCRKVLIDHHPDPAIGADLSVSRPEASSTSELVTRIIWQMGGFAHLGTKGAAALYCGMMTDTGCFTYNSSRPEAFLAAGLLLTKGIDKDRIYRRVYGSYRESRVRLMGYVLHEKLVVVKERAAAYFTLTREDLRRFQYVRGDAEGLVNLPLQIRGLRLSVSLREDTETDNLVWVSLRSVDGFPCNRMAERYFGGGGHLNASGGRLNCPMEEAVQAVRRAIDEFDG